MFKYLLLKSCFKLLDRGLVKRTMADMLFKFFLGYNSDETKLIDLNLLTDDRRIKKLSNIKEQIEFLKETMGDTGIELEYSRGHAAKNWT